MHWLKQALWLAEAAIIFPLYALFRLLPMDIASMVGGAVFRTFGPYLPVARVGRTNLRLAFPDLPEIERDVILEGVFENLGRVFAEFPHLSRITRERVEIVGVEFVHAIRDDNWTGMLFTAHLGNWEVLPPICEQQNLPLAVVYRAVNNPYLDKLLKHCRNTPRGRLLPKGREGARQAMVAMAKGEHVGMLVDQKMNDGIAVPFFGRPAMTAPALTQLALRFDCPVLPMRVERLKGVQFRVTVGPILVLPRTGERDADIREGTAVINRIMEGWIRDRPEQWLWLHRRWPES
ncbi:MAG: lauroyl acyltransferase [Alphaproteobacteria bacterium]|nr:lauroyl acyltransferase [Alphaproteobacteria bacterium]TAD89620.1 MAG: lauroyl acyltransferase [Alphaproteobacteria bacterium]